jgi:hypothetical protein
MVKILCTYELHFFTDSLRELCNKLLCGDVFVQFTKVRKNFKTKLLKCMVHFLKVKILEPLMDAKLNYKTKLQKPFIVFSSRFVRVWLQSYQKVLIRPQIFS